MDDWQWFAGLQAGYFDTSVLIMILCHDCCNAIAALTCSGHLLFSFNKVLGVFQAWVPIPYPFSFLQLPAFPMGLLTKGFVGLPAYYFCPSGPGRSHTDSYTDLTRNIASSPW